MFVFFKKIYSDKQRLINIFKNQNLKNRNNVNNDNDDNNDKSAFNVEKINFAKFRYLGVRKIYFKMFYLIVFHF